MEDVVCQDKADFPSVNCSYYDSVAKCSSSAEARTECCACSGGQRATVATDPANLSVYKSEVIRTTDPTYSWTYYFHNSEQILQANQNPHGLCAAPNVLGL